MQLSINKIAYGNPTIQHKKMLEDIGFVDDLFDGLKDKPFPLNDSESTRQELNQIIDFLGDIGDESNKKYLHRYLFYDKNLSQAIANSFVSSKIDVPKLISDIKEDVDKLIIKLKYFYNRPRPYQLSKIYKLNLFPYNTVSSATPSYPSGHAIQANVILSVISNLMPENSERASLMINDISSSRMYLGVHYESDNDFAEEVSKAILTNPKFAKKYGI